MPKPHLGHSKLTPGISSLIEPRLHGFSFRGKAQSRQKSFQSVLFTHVKARRLAKALPYFFVVEGGEVHHEYDYDRLPGGPPITVLI